MSAVLRLRTPALPVVAAALISATLGIQVAHGGGDFTPLRPADPCAVTSVTSVSTGLDGLSERLVVLGLDGAACQLKITREALTLHLAEPGTRSDAQVNAVRAGLLRAVQLMKTDRTLPRASALTDEALDRSNLNRFLKTAIRALPDSVIDAALKTDDVLNRTINSLDLKKLLANLDNPDDLTIQINTAITKAVEQSLIGRLRGLL